MKIVGVLLSFPNLSAINHGCAQPPRDQTKPLLRE
jgi:hypothetical protein